MNLSLGIVGLPNVGKSTLFNTLTNIRVPAENYPFCTIEPNIGVVEVPDSRIPVLAEIVKTQKLVYPVVEFVDIAGLVKGAHDGEGLGNQFLANIRNTDAIVHIIRAFESSEIVHVENRIDPLKDKEIVETELILKDLDSIMQKINKYAEEVRRDKKNQKFLDLLHEVKATLEQGKLVYSLPKSIDDPDLNRFRKELFLITDKPVLYLLNVNEVSFDREDLIKRYRTLINEPEAFIIPMNIKQENELSLLSLEDREEMAKELGVEFKALAELLTQSYKLLGLITFFTAGEQEVRGWTIGENFTAPMAAGAIHTDFEKKFISADVVKYQDFVNNNGWVGARSAGKVKAEGKEYIFKDGDVAIFKHGA